MMREEGLTDESFMDKEVFFQEFRENFGAAIEEEGSEKTS